MPRWFLIFCLVHRAINVSSIKKYSLKRNLFVADWTRHVEAVSHPSHAEHHIVSSFHPNSNNSKKNLYSTCYFPLHRDTFAAYHTGLPVAGTWKHGRPRSQVGHLSHWKKMWQGHVQPSSLRVRVVTVEDSGIQSKSAAIGKMESF
jgi:hypothetical protein